MREEAVRTARFIDAQRRAELPQDWFVQVDGPLGIRARRVLDGIAASVRRHGAVMVVKQGRAWEKHSRNYVVYCDWEFEIRVREKTTSKPRPENPRNGRDRYARTGKLCVDVDHEYAKWIDGKRLLEQRVDVVADYLDRHLNQLRVGWNEIDERERAREEAVRNAAQGHETANAPHSGYSRADERESAIARLWQLHQQMAVELSKLQRP